MEGNFRCKIVQVKGIETQSDDVDNPDYCVKATEASIS